MSTFFTFLLQFTLAPNVRLFYLISLFKLPMHLLLTKLFLNCKLFSLK